MENGTFAQCSKCSIFHNNLENLTFQRCPKALVWSKGLNSASEENSIQPSNKYTYSICT